MKLMAKHKRRVVVTMVVDDEVQAIALAGDVRDRAGWGGPIRWHEETFDPRIKAWEQTTEDRRVPR